MATLYRIGCNGSCWSAVTNSSGSLCINLRFCSVRTSHGKTSQKGKFVQNEQKFSICQNIFQGHSTETKECNPDVWVSKYFGIFFFFFEVTQVTGNLISSVVLTAGQESDIFIPDGTLTPENITRIDENCGAAARESEGSCPDPVEDTSRFILIAVYLALGGAAIAIAVFFLDNIKIRTELKEPSPKEMIVATAKHWLTDRRQQVLTLLTMYSGFKQSFLAADLTENYVTCPLGIEWIGYVLIAYVFDF